MMSSAKLRLTPKALLSRTSFDRHDKFFSDTPNDQSFASRFKKLRASKKLSEAVDGALQSKSLQEPVKDKLTIQEDDKKQDLLVWSKDQVLCDLVKELALREAILRSEEFEDQFALHPVGTETLVARARQREQDRAKLVREVRKYVKFRWQGKDSEQYEYWNDIRTSLEKAEEKRKEAKREEAEMKKAEEEEGKEAKKLLETIKGFLKEKRVEGYCVVYEDYRKFRHALKDIEYTLLYSEPEEQFKWLKNAQSHTSKSKAKGKDKSWNGVPKDDIEEHRWKEYMDARTSERQKFVRCPLHPHCSLICARGCLTWNPPHVPKRKQETRKLRKRTFWRGIIETKLRRIIRGVTAACQEANAHICIPKATYKNMLGRFVGDNAKEGTTLLGALVFDDMHDYPSFLAEWYRSKSIEITIDNFKPKPKVADAKAGVVQLKEFDKMKTKGLHDDDEPLRNEYPIPGISHLLIFEHAADRERFFDEYKNRVASGYIMMGGLRQSWVAAMEAVEKRQPLFAFKHLGGATSLMIRSLEFLQHLNRNEEFNTEADDRQVFLLDNDSAARDNFLTNERKSTGFCIDTWWAQYRKSGMFRRYPSFFFCLLLRASPSPLLRAVRVQLTNQVIMLLFPPKSGTEEYRTHESRGKAH